MATPMSEKTQLQDAIEEQLEPHANRDDATDAATGVFEMKVFACDQYHMQPGPLLSFFAWHRALV